MGERYLDIVEGLKASSVRVVTSLPDSWLGNLLGAVEDDPSFTHIPVCREEEGMAICCGALLAGSRSAMVMQNAGLLSSGNGINLARMYNLPLVMLISYRGVPSDPLHYQLLKGTSTEPVLRALNVTYAVAKDDIPLSKQVANAFKYAEGLSHPYALLLGERELT